MLDEGQSPCLAGPLLHHSEHPGGGGAVGLRDAVPGLPADPQQGRVEAEPPGFLQHVGPELPLRDHLAPGLRPL